MKTLKTITIIVAIVALFWAVLANASRRDEQLKRLDACVANKAHADGFTANPHSQEAWERYVSQC